MNTFGDSHFKASQDAQVLLCQISSGESGQALVDIRFTQMMENPVESFRLLVSGFGSRDTAPRVDGRIVGKENRNEMEAGIK